MAKKKTALKDLSKWIADKWSDPGKLISCVEVSDKINELLEKERHEILMAYDAGVIDELLKIEKSKPNNNSAEQYFTKTFEDGK